MVKDPQKEGKADKDNYKNLFLPSFISKGTCNFYITYNTTLTSGDIISRKNNLLGQQQKTLLVFLSMQLLLYNITPKSRGQFLGEQCLSGNKKIANSYILRCMQNLSTIIQPLHLHKVETGFLSTGSSYICTFLSPLYVVAQLTNFLCEDSTVQGRDSNYRVNWPIQAWLAVYIATTSE